MMKKKKVIILSIGILIMVILFSGYAYSKYSSTEVDHIESLADIEHVDLSEVENVVTFSAVMPLGLDSEANWDRELENRQNIVFFLTKTGDWKPYSTSLLENSSMEWTAEGLYFSDIEYDYFIDAKGNVNKQDNVFADKNKTEGTIGQSQKFKDPSGQVWSISGVGFKNNGYETQITRQHKNKVYKYNVEGAYSHFFYEDEKLYATTVAISLDNSINDDSYIRLVEFEESEQLLRPKIIGEVPFDVDRVLVESFKVGNTLYSIGETWDFESSLNRDLSLFSWDLNQGTSTSEVLIPNIHEEKGYDSSLTQYEVITEVNRKDGFDIKSPWGSIYEVDLERNTTKLTKENLIDRKNDVNVSSVAENNLKLFSMDFQREPNFSVYNYNVQDNYQENKIVLKNQRSFLKLLEANNIHELRLTDLTSKP